MARYTVTIDEREFDIEIEYRSERYVTKVNGRDVDLRRQGMGGSRSLLLVDNEAYEVDVRRNGDDTNRMVFMRGTEIALQIEDYNLAQLRKTAGMAAGGARETVLTAPMPGLVVNVRVEAGDAVKKNQAVVVMEAMKMENVLKAPADGKIKAVHVSSGQSVEKGEKLIEFE